MDISLECWNWSFNNDLSLRPATLLVTVVQVFSCEFYEILKNLFLIKHLRATASVRYQNFLEKTSKD